MFPSSTDETGFVDVYGSGNTGERALAQTAKVHPLWNTVLFRTGRWPWMAERWILQRQRQRQETRGSRHNDRKFNSFPLPAAEGFLSNITGLGLPHPPEGRRHGPHIPGQYNTIFTGPQLISNITDQFFSYPCPEGHQQRTDGVLQRRTFRPGAKIYCR
jgi:hypothetical protein